MRPTYTTFIFTVIGLFTFTNLSLAQSRSEIASSTTITPVIEYILNADDSNECNDGIDNDGDGLIDWQFDVGCWGAEDNTERAGTREQENGWTTFDPSADSRIIYVSSSDGNDTNDGLTPQTAKATPNGAIELIRNGFPDYLLLKRGDTWRDETLRRREIYGRSSNEKVVIGSYGASTERPRFEVKDHFINSNGKRYEHLAITGLALISYTKEPNSPDFDGESDGAIRLVAGNGNDFLLEDNYVEYGEFIIQNVTNVEVRRNVVYRSYHIGTCAFDSNGNRTRNGNVSHRPSGMFVGNVTGMLLQENVWDENGWNPDIPVGTPSNPGACATIYNHNVYLANVKEIEVLNEVVLRASSIGIKVSGTNISGVDDITIDNSLFAEGEIGIAMSGNGNFAYTHVNSIISNNVFTDIGRAQPTTGTLSWGITINNNDNVQYLDNLFVNPANRGNTFVFHLQRANNDILIENNIGYNYDRALRLTVGSPWQNVQIKRNNFIIPSGGTRPIVNHLGSFNGTTYTGNAYFSNYDTSRWFDSSGFHTINAWRALSGENDAVISNFSPQDASRNVDSYAATLGIGSTLDDFAREARKQSRFNWRPEYQAQTVNHYIRTGFRE